MHSSTHNHQDCIDTALQQARLLCRNRQQRLTPIREQVLRCVWSSHRAIGAYSIIHELAKQSSKAPAPPTVYRALDFLLDSGLIHRVNSLNAFIGCSSPGHPQNSPLLICRLCQNTLELVSTSLDSALAQAAAAQSFTLEQASIEVSGVCQHCQSQALPV